MDKHHDEIIDAYNEGFENGYIAGKDNSEERFDAGYIQGHKEGLDDGYRAGYEEGQKNAKF